MRKAPKGGRLHPLHERGNRTIAMVRAKVEHPFRVLKRQFGHVKTRLSGLGQEPCKALHTVRARQPVSGAKEVDGMRASLPEICLATSMARLEPQNQLPKTRLEPDTPIKPPSRRSRTR